MIVQKIDKIDNRIITQMPANEAAGLISRRGSKGGEQWKVSYDEAMRRFNAGETVESYSYFWKPLP